MKAIKLTLSLFMLLFMASCNQNEFQGIETMDSSVTGIISDAATSRTLMNNNMQVVWLEGDDISFIGRKGWLSQHVVSTGVNTNNAEFTVVSNTSIKVSETDLPYNYAIYPHSNDYTISDNIITVDVSNWANQNYVEGSFEDDKAIMTAKSANTVFPFKNAYSILELKLTTDVPGSYSVMSYSVTSKDHALNGPATIDMTSETPHLVCTGTPSEHHTNKLTLSTPVVLENTPVSLYLLIPAKLYGKNDLTIKVQLKDEMNDKDIPWETTIPVAVECFRSYKTTLEHEFEAGKISGSTDGVN